MPEPGRGRARRGFETVWGKENGGGSLLGFWSVLMFFFPLFLFGCFFSLNVHLGIYFILFMVICFWESEGKVKVSGRAKSVDWRWSLEGGRENNKKEMDQKIHRPYQQDQQNQPNDRLLIYYQSRTLDQRVQ